MGRDGEGRSTGLGPVVPPIPQPDHLIQRRLAVPAIRHPVDECLGDAVVTRPTGPRARSAERRPGCSSCRNAPLPPGVRRSGWSAGRRRRCTRFRRLGTACPREPGLDGRSHGGSIALTKGAAGATPPTAPPLPSPPITPPARLHPVRAPPAFHAAPARPGT